MMFKMNKPASPRALAAASLGLRLILQGGRVPRPLLEQWKLADGFQGDDVEFFSTDEIIERNETLEVQNFAPGYLAFASDAGSRVALLQAEEDAERVLISYAGELKIETLKDSGMAIYNWVQSGCPFSFSPRPLVSAVEQVVLRLDAVPREGLKGLLEIKKLCSLNVGLSELREIGGRLPYVIGSMSYIKALRFAAKINKDESCVSIWTVACPPIRLPLINPFE